MERRSNNFFVLPKNLNYMKYKCKYKLLKNNMNKGAGYFLTLRYFKTQKRFQNENFCLDPGCEQRNTKGGQRNSLTGYGEETPRMLYCCA